MEHLIGWEIETAKEYHPDLKFAEILIDGELSVASSMDETPEDTVVVEIQDGIITQILN